MKFRTILNGLTLGLCLSLGTAHAGLPASNSDDPTAESILKDGPFKYGTVSINNAQTPGFGAATIYYPISDKGERFGGIVTVPGYFEPQSTMKLFGTRLASHGFVVMTIDVQFMWDYPTARARAAKSALTYLTQASPAKDKVDPARLALIGHSMGGGAALEAAETTPLKAVLALNPWAQRTNPTMSVPTLVVGGSLDNVAPPSRYSDRIYAGLTGTSQRAYLLTFGGSHWASVSDDPLIQGRNLAWLKVFVDGDSRYQPFACEKAKAGTAYQATPCR